MYTGLLFFVLYVDVMEFLLFAFQFFDRKVPFSSPSFEAFLHSSRVQLFVWAGTGCDNIVKSVSSTVATCDVKTMWRHPTSLPSNARSWYTWIFVGWFTRSPALAELQQPHLGPDSADEPAVHTRWFLFCLISSGFFWRMCNDSNSLYIIATNALEAQLLNYFSRMVIFFFFVPLNFPFEGLAFWRSEATLVKSSWIESLESLTECTKGLSWVLLSSQGLIPEQVFTGTQCLNTARAIPTLLNVAAKWRLSRPFDLFPAVSSQTPFQMSTVRCLNRIIKST